MEVQSELTDVNDVFNMVKEEATALEQTLVEKSARIDELEKKLDSTANEQDPLEIATSKVSVNIIKYKV